MADLFHQYEDAEGRVKGDFAQVALEQGLETPDGLTYAVPGHLKGLKIGDRVKVPLGRSNRSVHGYVLSLSELTKVDPLKLKEIIDRDENAVNLPDNLIKLAKWISHYYCSPLGMVFASMLPAAVKKGTGAVNRKFAELAEGVSQSRLDELKTEHKLKGKQFEVLKAAVAAADADLLPMGLSELAERGGAKSENPVKGLVDKGLLNIVTKRQVRAVWTEHAVEPNKFLTLNDMQQKAVDKFTAAIGTGYRPFLLYGVTGSGKTEVYIKAIEPVVERGDVAIVLVPEIALTPQTVGRFIGRFKKVAVLHSGLTAAQRHEQWQLIRSGWAQVIVGARSAIFAPVENLGLIIVDEEHDSSYKQDQAPRYHGRDVAMVRAHNEGIPIILGSATPSLESWHNATNKGAYELVTLEKRVSDLPLPKVTIVDLSEEPQKRYEMKGQRGQHVLSIQLEGAMQQTFKAGGQVMLLLNRRGYASFIACSHKACDWTMTCEHCDVQMVYHLNKRLPTGGLVRCHYCQLESILPSACPVCNSKISTLGLGTQRAEEEIKRKFPDIRMLRMDSDSMKTSQDYASTLEAFKKGEAELLLGTQMIAKGLDFPNVQLVGVITTDTALNMPDFRAAERTFQLVSQVSGRSGRAEASGRVILQTFNAEHPAITMAAEHDYVAFANMELELRVMTKLPPAMRMVRIIVRHTEVEKAEAHVNELASVLKPIIERKDASTTMVGPMPCSIARIASYHRFEIQMIAKDAVTLQGILHEARMINQLHADRFTAIDVDPVCLI